MKLVRRIAALGLGVALAVGISGGTAGVAHANPGGNGFADWWTELGLPGPAPDVALPPGLLPPPAPQTPGAPPVPGPVAPAPFTSAGINPAAGELVGVAQPVIINFPAPISDRAAAERAISVTSAPPVSGRFIWFSNSQVRWRPHEFWPAHAQVTVVAGPSRSNFRTGDATISVADDVTKTITVTRNGQIVRTMPVSFGKDRTPTPNGTYIIGERHRHMVMDSSTYGVPVDSPDGYRIDVEYATRMSNSGIFVHAAPWSLQHQGVRNVSAGCLNVSTDDARWFYENTRKGDPVIVRNTIGGRLNGWDGLGDWML
ncbi:L,D-transpeptidase [Hoyosella subflava]|uniref:ErfK/YbiS/YcfS/YnhG family protein n=1 Tax=Hoyosella subflava (strain DSM 45089 / JCM 17490 / NBRC 109087 / DQS3-9A1) TaxID=443218 RepID=F6EK65_HOYSD|nr:Ig-like domain-containing protein [Hoyosella subflava]AEF42606.1 ErfK/YbiS/YcfS/YnhG family protein [Hoyosella subflava DQS3-9A1]